MPLWMASRRARRHTGCNGRDMEQRTRGFASSEDRVAPVSTGASDAYGSAEPAVGAVGDPLEVRSTEQVFCDHLELRRLGRVEEDIERNYDPDVILLTTYGVFRGQDGVRHGAALLQSHIGDAEVTCTTRLVDGDVAFLEWTA